MDLIHNGWKHIIRNETSQKSLFKTFYHNKDFKNFPIRKSTLNFNLIKPNISNPLILFHGQTLWKDTRISLLVLGAKYLLIGLQSVLMATEFPYGINLSNLLFLEWVIHQIFYVASVESKMSLIPILYTIASYLKQH